MSERVTTRQVIAHAADCYAIKNVNDGTWATPWLTDDLTRSYRDKTGGLRGRNCAFLRFRCNCTHCPAIMLAREDDICRLLPPATLPGRAGKP